MPCKINIIIISNKEDTKNMKKLKKTTYNKNNQENYNKKNKSKKMKCQMKKKKKKISNNNNKIQCTNKINLEILLADYSLNNSFLIPIISPQQNLMKMKNKTILLQNPNILVASPHNTQCPVICNTVC